MVDSSNSSERKIEYEIGGQERLLFASVTGTATAGAHDLEAVIDESDSASVTKAEQVPKGPFNIDIDDPSSASPGDGYDQAMQGFAEKHTPELLNLINETGFEYGYDSPAEALVQRLFKNNKAFTKEWLNRVYISYISDVDVLTSILHIISHIDYSEVLPQGQTIALAALANINPQVREGGIRAYENWDASDSLDILKNTKCAEEWLQEYLNSVISGIEMDSE